LDNKDGRPLGTTIMIAADTVLILVVVEILCKIIYIVGAAVIVISSHQPAEL
jgi:hypothetical protein